MSNKETLDRMYGMVTSWGNQAGLTHHFVGAMYAREMRLRAGEVACMHVHDYDHESLYVGHVRVITDSGETEYQGSGSIIMPANCRHAIVAVTDSLWICAHPAEDLNDMDAVRIGVEQCH